MKFLTNLTLGKKITLLTTMGLLVGVIVFSSLGMGAVNRATETMLEDRLTTAGLVADYVDEALERALSELANTAQMIDIDETKESYQVHIEALETTYSRLSIPIHSIYLIDKAGEIRWSKPDIAWTDGDDSFHLSSFIQSVTIKEASVSGLTIAPALNVPVVFLGSPTGIGKQGDSGILLVAIEPAKSSIGGFVYPVRLKVTDNDGLTSVDESLVTVHNVAPTVSLSSDSPRNELDPVTVSGTVTDPGWLENLTATINWGDGSPIEVVSGTLEQVRPDATLSFNISHIYGDNGTFTAEVCGYDDDTSSCATIGLEILNVPPTAEIDGTAVVDGCGGDAFIAHAGDEVSFTGHSTDPGSDDLTLTWVWGDGTADTSTDYLVNPPNPDPFPSPSIQPRDVTDTQTHTFNDACIFEITFSSTDDDGGSALDSEDVVIVGNAELIRSAGYWRHQYRGRGRIRFSPEELQCYLDIVNHLSSVFSEETDASDLDAAEEVLDPSHSNGEIRVQFDRQLLAVWLNFANGAIEYDELVDTDFDLVPDTELITFLCAAEAARLNPATTDSELEDLKDLLEAINLLDD